MKNLIITTILALLTAGGITAAAQQRPDEYLGLPGDNLNLYAVMNLFQESETLEGFEKKLNEEDYRINNLDLNGDNLIDYIMVSDYVDGNVHNIVLRVALDRNEYQDVAVFTVQKFGDGSVQIQLIGDEALYGRNYIIEPIYAETPNPGYTGRNGNSARVTVVGTTYYEVATWPVIRYIYRPTYVVWRSGWYWGYWPTYWSPWRPYYWHFYSGYHYSWNNHYHNRYRHWETYRYTGYNDFYYASVRRHSPVVIVNINSGNYKSSYSRPEQRRTGEAFYASVHTGRSNNGRSGTTTDNNTNRRVAVPESARVQPNNSTRNVSESSSTNRVTGNRTNTGTVRNSSATVQRSNDAAQRTTTATQRSTGTTQNTRATVQRSNDAAQRTTTATQRSNSTPPKSSTTVQRSSNASQRTTTATQKSSNTGQKASSSSSDNRRVSKK